MAIFNRYSLTRKGQKLITKAQAGRTEIKFTKFATGSGTWTSDEDLESAAGLKEQRQQFTFSDITIPDGNPSTVVLTVNITNEDLSELYFLGEAGIMAKDPDEGEILYVILVSETATVSVPAYNGTGHSNIVERINIEVANAPNVTVSMEGAHVSATDYTGFKKEVLAAIAELQNRVSALEEKSGTG